jgi:hypothetical protein
LLIILNFLFKLVGETNVTFEFIYLKIVLEVSASFVLSFSLPSLEGSPYLGFIFYLAPPLSSFSP